MKDYQNLNILACGRNLGKIEIENKSVILVGTTDRVEPFNVKQYKVWESLLNKKNMNEWLEQLTSYTEAEIEEGIEYLTEKGLALIKEDVDSPNNFLVSRNGVGIGVDQGRWQIKAPNKEKRVELTKQQYLVWISATGITTITEVISNICDLLDCNQKEAESLFWECAELFLKIRLWIIEHCEEEVSFTYKKKKIDTQIKDKTIFLPVGQTVGYIEGNSFLNDGFYISMGGQYIDVSAAEYLIWISLKKSLISVKQLSKAMEVSRKVLKKEILPSLIEKNLLIEYMEDGLFAELVPLKRGIVTSTKEENVTFTTCALDDRVTLPKACHIVWNMMNPFSTYEDLVRELVKSDQIPLTEAKILIKDALLPLLQNDLVEFQMIKRDR
ncbi:hypothetical protein [Priestia megaterium]|uniref:hypothetical protein n=1 Tax=Priestia megaterium TaxID=1404 RepID=UPI00300827A7